MTRDMDVIRRICLALRLSEVGIQGVEGIEKDAFNFNAVLMIEAGLAHGFTSNENTLSQAPSLVRLRRLTWAGEDFASAAQNDTVWNRVKTNVLKPGASWSFGILTDVLKSEAAKAIASAMQ